jgi:DNA-binding NtrC family response regulator
MLSQKKEGSVIIVDDEIVSAEALSEYLEIKGFQAMAFADPREALTAIAQGAVRADILVSDYSMPGMNGLELISEAKKACPEILAILMSGFGDNSINWKLLCEGFFAKPVHFSKMAEKLNELLA